jgi:hypothetical protein
MRSFARRVSKPESPPGVRRYQREQHMAELILVQRRRRLEAEGRTDNFEWIHGSVDNRHLTIADAVIAGRHRRMQTQTSMTCMKRNDN